MPINRDPRTDGWFYRKVVRLPDGTRHRLFGTPAKFNLPNTKAGAEEAERLAIAQVREHGSVEPPPPPAPPPEPKRVPTLAEYAREHWLPIAKVDVKPSTLRGKAKTLRRLLRAWPQLGDTPLDQLDLLTIDRVRQRLVDSGLKPGTINTTLAQLRHLLGAAHDHGLVDTVPKVRLLRDPARKVDFLTQDELDRLLAAPVPPQVRLMIQVAAQTGLRIGELRALRWDDVDFERRQLHVRHTWSEGHLLSPKGGRSRDVPLPRASLASLASWRPHATGPLVFPGRNGHHLKDDTVYAWLEHATSAAGIRHIGWHVLRHTYASHLVQSGVSLYVVQALLGHATAAMTQRYAHLAPSNLHDAVTVLDRA